MATQPTLAMIPSGYKDGKLYSVLPSDGVGDFDVTRGSNATRINKDGLIETVTGNTPRLNYPLIDGVVSGCPSLLLEPARTNLITYSEDFSNVSWTKLGSSVTSGFISPTGGLDAFKLIEGSSSGTHEMEVIGLVVTANKYSMSLFAKADERGKIRVQLRNYFAGNPSVIFDLENGTFEQNAQAIGSMTLLENGFYRCTFKTVLNAIAGGNAILNINLVDETNQISYQGDGTSGVYLWGAMLEQGSYPTSYIKSNSGSTTTRLADTANNAGKASTFNDSEGVLMAEISDLYSGGGGVISINTGNNTQKIFLYLLNNTTVRYYAQGSGGVITDDIPISSASNFNKIVFKYKSSDFAVWINGFELYTNTSAITFSNLSSLDFHNPYLGGTENFYGKTKQIQYYNTALTDLELETLTSYTSFNAMALAQNYKIQ